MTISPFYRLQKIIEERNPISNIYLTLFYGKNDIKLFMKLLMNIFAYILGIS